MRDVGGAEFVPGQAHPFAPVCRTFLLCGYIQPNYLVQEVRDNHDGLYGYGYGAHPPVADPPEAFLGGQPHAAPPADVPPANGLRNLAGRFLNNPDTLVNMLRIEPGPGGRFAVWIELELADI
jgi:hypothetical protein